MEIGESLTRERVAAGMTQQQLAEASGVDQTVISRLERGLAILTLLQGRKIASALDISIDRLTTGCRTKKKSAAG